MTDTFLLGAGGFLVISSLALYLMRVFLARTGEASWSWLPEGSRFKTRRTQYAFSIAAAAIVCVAGLALVVFAML